MVPVRSGYKIIYANVRNHDSVAKVSLRPSRSLLPVSISTSRTSVTDSVIISLQLTALRPPSPLKILDINIHSHFFYFYNKPLLETYLVIRYAL